MKKSLKVLALALAASLITFSACNKTQETEKDGLSADKGSAAVQDTITKDAPPPDPAAELLQKAESNPANPEYIISVKHGKKELGEIKIMLFPDAAPEHVRNFDSLVAIKFYDGTAFHRVIPDFMIQGGDPNSKKKPKSTWGEGDPSQRAIVAEFNAIKHVPGIISAARTPDPNSATSQFFICVGTPSQLDGQYTVFGKTTAGMDIVNEIVNAPRDEKDNPLEKVEMKIVRVKK